MEKKTGFHLLLFSLALFLIAQTPFFKEVFIRSKVQQIFFKSADDQDATLELLSLENLLLKDELDAIRNQLNYEQKEWDVIHANVIYRENISFGSFVWIDRGYKDNARFLKEVIGKNSPVILGKSLVGVVEEVLENKSLVRLITDPKIQVAVRVDRGKKAVYVHERLEELATIFQSEELLFKNAEQKKLTLELFQYFLDKGKVHQGELLAKGVIQGVQNPGWRIPRLTLEGYGFNYDFKDTCGGPYDLRDYHILKVGDLLVTTGLDGVFPRGLHVAVVTNVDPLKEGSYAYTLQASPCAVELAHLNHVQVLPALFK
jgi:cell shape-determining protein MreC